MKIIYIGSSGSLSLIPLQALISSKHEICALAFDDLNTSFNVVTPNSIQSLALRNSIPFIKFDKKYTGVLSQLTSYQADLIIVSCYARKLPYSIFSLSKKGCFNIHPSLLPKFRGPVPLFWQFRDGISDFGVTVHRVDEEFDAGNIISQTKVEMRDGISIKEATELLAFTARDLILSTLNDIEDNSTIEIQQNKPASNYQSFPVLGDYTVSPLWTAKRIYNFINAYKAKDASFLCEVDGVNYKLINAYSYQENPYDNMNGNITLQEGDKISFACQNSYIQCQIWVEN